MTPTKEKCCTEELGDAEVGHGELEVGDGRAGIQQGHVALLCVFFWGLLV